jgi:hypothetical protein
VASEAPHVSALLAREDHGGAEDLYRPATWWLMAISWPRGRRPGVKRRLEPGPPSEPRAPLVPRRECRPRVQSGTRRTPSTCPRTIARHARRTARAPRRAADPARMPMWPTASGSTVGSATGETSTATTMTVLRSRGSHPADSVLARLAARRVARRSSAGSCRRIADSSRIAGGASPSRSACRPRSTPADRDVSDRLALVPGRPIRALARASFREDQATIHSRCAARRLT